MFKILICCCLIATVFGSAIDFNKINNANAEILIVENIEEFKKQNPLIKLSPLQKINNLGVIRYTLGGRVSTDVLVGHGADGANWSSPQNVKLTIQYPRSGSGLRVTFVEILVDQSSDIGNGYVIGGGIGQRKISVVIEAGSTLHFVYSYAIYGDLMQ